MSNSNERLRDELLPPPTEGDMSGSSSMPSSGLDVSSRNNNGDLPETVLAKGDGRLDPTSVSGRELDTPSNTEGLRNRPSSPPTRGRPSGPPLTSDGPNGNSNERLRDELLPPPTNGGMLDPPSPPDGEPDTPGRDPEEVPTKRNEPLISVFRYSAGLSVLLGILGLLGFYIYVQTVYLVTALLTLPEFLCIPLFGILILLFSLVVCCAYDCWRVYRRLKKNSQVIWADLQKMQNHQQIAGAKAAKNHLVKYLKEYPVPKRKAKSEFFKPDEIGGLNQTYSYLINENCPVSTTEWKAKFEQEFLSVLDTAAQRQIDEASTLSAIKAAISPYAVLDMLIILYWSFKMVQRLCQIYNVRTGGFGTVYLLCCIFGNTFFAGKLNDFETEIGKNLAEFLPKQSIFEFLPSTMQGMAESLAGKFAGKAVTGLANYLLMKRLGYRAMQMLKPLR